MRILLDTRMVIRWLDGAPELPPVVAAGIADAKADDLLRENGLEILDFTSSHARRMLELPLHHRDPFDRMLIA